jgi:SAM-dependent methyltransferase
MSDSWVRFWDRPHSIYANDRHLAVHCAHVAGEIVSVLPAKTGLRVLDYGCGEALSAGRVAERVAQLCLYDAAATVRAHLDERFAGVPNISMLDDAALDRIAPGSLDVIVLFSVVQYIDRAQFPALLRRLRGWLAQDGLLIISDVIPPNASMVEDIQSLLRTAWRYGFLIAALGGLAATFFSDYRRLRQQLGFATYDDVEMRALLSDAGYRCERYARNLGFHPGRRTYMARPV